MNKQQRDAAERDSGSNGFRQYRAPMSHGELFVDPVMADVSEAVRQNVLTLCSHPEPFASLRRQARQQLIADAVDYSSAYRDVSWLRYEADTPLLMAGHQPSLFHPGVWLKNFALSHLAHRNGAVAVNLVIDNDVAAGSSIRVPTFDVATGTATYTSVAYDEAAGGVPYEQTTIRDRARFDQFDRRVAEVIRPVVEDPCVIQMWKHARSAIRRCGIAGCALAQARHGLEDDIGLNTLELPLGVLCRTTAFAEFVLMILGELPRFVDCYNEAATKFRVAHAIRSTAHPVPNLAHQDDWFESPLWVYGDDAPQRRPVWVRRTGDLLVLSDWHGRSVELDMRAPERAAEQLASHASPNFKLRPRALLTTMYARLVLSDLFLHGIGGGKYDQLGNIIVEEFFGIRPPTFMVVSATVRLPGYRSADANQPLREIRRLKREIRDTKFQGERFAEQTSLDPDKLQRKRELLRTIPPRGRKAAWHAELASINKWMEGELQETREQLRQQLAIAERKLASLTLMSGREHPFCLFPLDDLTRTYQALLGVQ